MLFVFDLFLFIYKKGTNKIKDAHKLVLVRSFVYFLYFSFSLTKSPRFPPFCSTTMMVINSSGTGRIDGSIISHPTPRRTPLALSLRLTWFYEAVLRLLISHLIKNVCVLLLLFFLLLPNVFHFMQMLMEECLHMTPPRMH